MSTSPPFLLRLSVVVGSISLLLGLVGVGWLIVNGDDSASAAGAGLGEYLRVVGLGEDVVPEVTVQWAEGDIVHVEPARPLASAAGSFLLPPGLAGRRVLIEVRDLHTSLSLASQELVPIRGTEIQIEIAETTER